jgi:SAM-dependent methyltransferase
VTRNLEIGPGNTRLPGFETLNVVKTAVTDHVGDARKPPFPDGSFDLVFSSHCIEHIQWYEVEDTIKQWVRIIKPGGHLEVWTVNALALMQAIIELDQTGVWTGPTIGTWKSDLTKYDPYKWAVARIMNYPKKGPHGDVWLHRSILTPNYMHRCLSQAGLVDIRPLAKHEVRGKDHGWINMGITGRKPC